MTLLTVTVLSHEFTCLEIKVKPSCNIYRAVTQRYNSCFLWSYSRSASSTSMPAVDGSTWCWRSHSNDRGTSGDERSRNFEEVARSTPFQRRSLSTRRRLNLDTILTHRHGTSGRYTARGGGTRHGDARRCRWARWWLFGGRWWHHGEWWHHSGLAILLRQLTTEQGPVGF